MSASTHTIFIRPEAPPKPHWGAACNGCGVCCLVEPCPLGMVLSGKRRGACGALRWSDADGVYRCGAIRQPHAVARAALPRAAQFLAPALGWLLARLARRWVAAGQGCDSNVQVQAATSTTIPLDSPNQAPVHQDTPLP